jgi:large subunit ribosomal protein L4
METTLYNQKAEKAGDLKLEASLFGQKWNADLVHQVVFSMLSNARPVVAHAKDRGEVSGGGKKPWRQKGTGRSRHGSSRSPIWVGGGTTHGPNKEANYTKKINKKMKSKALAVLLSRKFKDGEMLFVDKFDFDGKTKTVVEAMKKFSAIKGFEKINYVKGSRALVVTPDKDTKLEKAFANIKSAQVTEARNVNPTDLVTYKYVVLAGSEPIISSFKARMK